MSVDIICAEVRIGRPRDSMCEAHGIMSASELGRAKLSHNERRIGLQALLVI